MRLIFIMATNDDPQTSSMKEHWPKPTDGYPSPWGLPLTMVATGELVGVESVPQDSQVFRFQNWVAQIHIPIHPAEWINETYPGLLAKLDRDFLSLDLHRYHRGDLTVDHWEGRWYTIFCEPHFSYVPCKLSAGSHVDYKRLTWIQDDGMTP